ncbi:MAG: hypothetical protein CML56_04600 [Rhodobacteraceae bacterium]|mgnify:CR=1 FL=1|nr:hypothetical protein [Paracoccaceae bacterium]
MSLKSRKSVDSAGPDIHEETSVSWQRNDDKTYTKVTKVTHRDRKTGIVKPMKRLEPIVEGPYEVVASAEESDTQFEYLGLNNEKAYVYLKIKPTE